MSTQESTYWSSEFSDAELNREADAGDFLLAAEAIIKATADWPIGWESWGEVTK